MSGIMAIAGGVGNLADLNMEAQATTALELFSFMNAYFSKTEKYTAQLTRDQILYFAATLSVSQAHPERAAESSADYQKYTMDSNDMDSQLSALNALIQNGKTRIRQEGNANDNLFSIEEPFVQLLKMTVAVILGFFK